MSERKLLPIKSWKVFTLILCIVLGVGVLAFFIGKDKLPSLGLREAEAEEAYVKNIEALNTFPAPAFPDVHTAEGFFTSCFPNLIVRVHTTARGKSTVFDPEGEYTIKDVRPYDEHGHAAPANAYISTPYEMEITEVLFGDANLFRTGELFTYYAPYGEIYMGADSNTAYIRYEHYPILMTDRDYILFLFVYENADGFVYELCHPCGALEITAEDENTFRICSDLGDDVFSECGYSVIRLENLITAYSGTLFSFVPNYSLWQGD